VYAGNLLGHKQSAASFSIMSQAQSGKEFESIERPKVAALDEILGTPFRVLDDGFVRLVDYMGSDASIVQAARVSYGKGTKRVSEDRGLIRYLMRNWHTTPFEMCELKLHVRVPMDCWRQWIRHRTANVNEYSTRYSEAIDAAQKTAPEEWRRQSTANRQGSGGFLELAKGEELTQAEAELHRASREAYEHRLREGVAREQARKDLPLSTYTEAYWKIDLHNLFHFLMLRLDVHAQLEIRSYAIVIGDEIVCRWCPLAWEAFVDYRLKSAALTRYDVEIIRALARGSTLDAIRLAREFGLLPEEGAPVKANRERSELEANLTKLGFDIPWAKLAAR
jgi:thymidylate synthase (FAD)